MCLWGVLARVVALYKMRYKTAAKTHIIRQVSPYNRLKLVRNHTKIIKIVLKHQDVSKNVLRAS